MWTSKPGEDPEIQCRVLCGHDWYPAKLRMGHLMGPINDWPENFRKHMIDDATVHQFHKTRAWEPFYRNRLVRFDANEDKELLRQAGLFVQLFWRTMKDMKHNATDGEFLANNPWAQEIKDARFFMERTAREMRNKVVEMKDAAEEDMKTIDKILNGELPEYRYVVILLGVRDPDVEQMPTISAVMSDP
ncbi:hypothetical protein BDY21DRAFT_364494 [Lineolata rhizophorae]|uniref:Uncharacterized protein n=1 Tax=Lineolata rhizophorae TaxID=578093 RepID=A0A6A6P0H6_9PEZI|nr:hypothetical protein BDY21DRAFT_364494 [Lineolata rhizophorae]